MYAPTHIFWRGFEAKLSADHAKWVGGRLNRAPDQWQPRLKKTYVTMFEKSGAYVANTWLRSASDKLATLLLPLNASDTDIRHRAAELADECMRSAGDVGGAGMVAFWRACERFCLARGVKPPPVSDGEEGQIKAAVLRMVCPLWWRRRLRVQHGRTIEENAIKLGYVHLRREKYVSDVNVRRRVQQKAANAATLANVTVTNQHGDEFTLAALAERSNANPHIRRSELMTRIAGFEHIAKGVGHAAEFWTGTCPSRLHARLADGGRPNPKHDGSSPREAQTHLAACWSRFRAWAARKGIGLYGFRIAEPHHDGCPHWHLLLFMAQDVVDKAREGFRKYFLDQHEPNEPGAAKNRVKFVSIDMEKGSAAGYVIKYISKNIDGYKVQQDPLGGCAVEGAARVDAWSATWGIRQFQQVGGAPVGVWRELRRLKESTQYTDLIERGRVVADEGDWRAYVQLQGGPFVARKDLAMRTAVSREGRVWCPVEERQIEAVRTRYGEESGGVVFGVRDMRDGLSFASRVFKWVVDRCLKASGFQGEVASIMSLGRSCFGAISGKGGGLGGSVITAEHGKAQSGFSGQVVQGEGVLASPWTRVNNYTVGVSDGFAKRPRSAESDCADDGEAVFGAGVGVPFEADWQYRAVGGEVESYRAAWG
jgi:hypothetical protein